MFTERAGASGNEIHSLLRFPALKLQLIDWLIALRHISTERLLVPRFLLNMIKIRRVTQLCMKKRWLAGLMAHQYKKLPVTMKMWIQFNVVPRTSLSRHPNSQAKQTLCNIQLIRWCSCTIWSQKHNQIIQMLFVNQMLSVCCYLILICRVFWGSL